MQFRQALFRCDDLYERIPIGKGRHYHVADAHATFLIVQDSTRHFSLHATVANDHEMTVLFQRTVAVPIKFEMLYVGKWKQNLLPLWRRTRFPGGRRRPSGDPDR